MTPCRYEPKRALKLARRRLELPPATPDRLPLYVHKRRAQAIAAQPRHIAERMERAASGAGEGGRERDQGLPCPSGPTSEPSTEAQRDRRAATPGTSPGCGRSRLQRSRIFIRCMPLRLAIS